MEPIGLFTEGFTKPPVFIGDVQIDIGNIARHSGSFEINGGPWSLGKQIIIIQSTGPYSGKGTREDEAEMDIVSLSGYVKNSSTIKAFWTCAPKNGPIKGQIKFGYVVGF